MSNLEITNDYTIIKTTNAISMYQSLTNNDPYDFMEAT